MKNHKRIAAGLLAAVSVFSLTACGGSGSGDTTTADVTTTAKTEWTGDNIEVTAEEGELSTDVDGYL